MTTEVWQSRGVCDFCGKPKATWDYPADPYVMLISDGESFQSDAGWLACDECAALINAGERMKLAQRTAEILNVPVTAAEVFQRGFWNFRCGEPIRMWQ